MSKKSQEINYTAANFFLKNLKIIHRIKIDKKTFFFHDKNMFTDMFCFQDKLNKIIK
jgi:hypothetical protein